MVVQEVTKKFDEGRSKVKEERSKEKVTGEVQLEGRSQKVNWLDREEALKIEERKKLN